MGMSHGADVEISLTIRMICTREDALDAAAQVTEHLRVAAQSACQARLGGDPLDLEIRHRVESW
jgi:hypothetical protein